MKTVGDLVQELLCKGGVQEAMSVEVKFNTGAVVTIHSDNHPVMNHDAEEVVSVTPKQSASAG